MGLLSILTVDKNSFIQYQCTEFHYKKIKLAMCTKLRQNGEILIPGNRGIIKTPKGEKTLVWGYDNGLGIQANARFESLREKWIPKKYQVGVMEIDSFWEGRRTTKEFLMPKNGLIGIIYKKDHFIVVTEEAGGPVSKVHHRQPCMRQLFQLLAVA
jgi:hypothetical protein